MAFASTKRSVILKDDNNFIDSFLHAILNLKRLLKHGKNQLARLPTICFF